MTGTTSCNANKQSLQIEPYHHIKVHIGVTNRMVLTVATKIGAADANNGDGNTNSDTCHSAWYHKSRRPYCVCANVCV